MKPYGMTVIEYGNDSKRAGDLKSPKRSTNRLGQKKALRRYKKAARRLNKIITSEHTE